MNSVGIGTRVFTFLIDSIFVFLLTYAAYRSWTWYVFYYKSTYLPFYVFWFIVTFLYYLFLGHLEAHARQMDVAIQSSR